MLAVLIIDEAIYEFGGLPRVRDQGLLESALDRNLLAYEPASSIFRLAAVLCFGTVPRTGGGQTARRLKPRSADGRSCGYTDPQ